MFPGYRISPLRAFTLDEINRVVDQVNRALLDIYGKANTGVFSGYAVTAGTLQGRPTINGVAFDGRNSIDIPWGLSNVSNYTAVTISTRVNGHYLNTDVSISPFDIGINNFTSSPVTANGYVLVAISGVDYKFLAEAL